MTTKAERDDIIHERWRARMENDFAPPPYARANA